MAKISKKLLLSGITSLSLVAFIVGATTFSWFQLNQSLSNIIIVDSGSLDLDYDVNVYKFLYPDFAGVISPSTSDELINYKDGVNGEVYEYDKDEVNSASTVISMNKYDPFYLELNPDDSVSVLMTNLVMKFDLVIDNSIDVHLNLSVVKFASIGEDEERISQYLDFWTVTSDQYDTQYAADTTGGATYVDEPTQKFHTVKNYAEVEDGSGNFTLTPTYTFIGNTDVSGTLFEQSIASGANEVTSEIATTNISFYVNIDYNQLSLADKSSTLQAGVTQSLYTDYYFLLNLEQV